jgi:hypothetical protein
MKQNGLFRQGLGEESGRLLKKPVQKPSLNWARGSKISTAQLNKFFAAFCPQKVAFSLFFKLYGMRAAS